MYGEIFKIMSLVLCNLIGVLQECESATHMLLIQRKGLSVGQADSPAHSDVSLAQKPLEHVRGLSFGHPL